MAMEEGDTQFDEILDGSLTDDMMAQKMVDQEVASSSKVRGGREYKLGEDVTAVTWGDPESHADPVAYVGVKKEEKRIADSRRTSADEIDDAVDERYAALRLGEGNGPTNLVEDNNLPSLGETAEEDTTSKSNNSTTSKGNSTPWTRNNSTTSKILSAGRIVGLKAMNAKYCGLDMRCESSAAIRFDVDG